MKQFTDNAVAELTAETTNGTIQWSLVYDDSHGDFYHSTIEGGGHTHLMQVDGRWYQHVCLPDDVANREQVTIRIPATAAGVEYVQTVRSRANT